MATDAEHTLVDQLRGAVIAAALTPMGSNGEVRPERCATYYAGLVSGGADALAIGAHTGRGGFLSASTRSTLIREAADLEVPVVAGVDHDDLVGAQAAAASGASALLVVPPEHPTASAAVEAHDRLHDASGLPMIAFDLYARPYPSGALDAVLEHPGVVAFKCARLHDAVACQDGIATARAHGTLVLTGEDRMFGPSLLWGAEGALVGIASASVGVTTAAMRTFHTGDLAAFTDASRLVDELAAVTFRPPVDGYIQRMLWIAADEGLISLDEAVDPWRPSDLRDDEHAEVVAVARRCRR